MRNNLPEWLNGWVTRIGYGYRFYMNKKQLFHYLKSINFTGDFWLKYDNTGNDENDRQRHTNVDIYFNSKQGSRMIYYRSHRRNDYDVREELLSKYNNWINEYKKLNPSPPTQTSS